MHYRPLKHILLSAAILPALLLFLCAARPDAPAFAFSPPYGGFPLPEHLTLCGEPVPLDNQAIREMLDRELIIAAYDRAQVILWLKRAGRFFPFIEAQLAERNMPEDLKYIAIAESNLLTYIRSNKGALGPWQFMRDTAGEYGLRHSGAIDERLHFEQATRAALTYLQRLHRMFDSWALAMAAFNCGKNRLKKEIEQQQVSDYYRLNLPQETERYIFRILAAKLIIENPARYGYDPAPSSLYQPIPIATIDLNLRAPVHMTDFARALDTDFKVIKKLNPQFTGHYLTPGKHTLNVPPGTEARAQTFIAEAARKAPARATAGSPDIYIVKPGDTLSHVSLRTGVPIKTLQTLNGLSTTVIFEGQRLRLKPAD